MKMDEDDYMSDQFLKQSDNRPGLVFQHSLKRKHDLEKKHAEANKKNYRKPIRVLEEEHRQEGLNAAIAENNKGFAMMQKMGYKPGMGLGKQGNSIREPIPLTLKSGRSGLGKESEEKKAAAELQAKITKLRQSREKARQETAEEYRERMRSKAMEKQINSDLALSQRICEKLDSKMDIEKPMKSWFWPEKIKEQDGDDEESNDNSEPEDDDDKTNDLQPSEKLSILTTYLRDTYMYCIWCGTQFEDKEDMDANCPGNTSECH